MVFVGVKSGKILHRLTTKKRPKPRSAAKTDTTDITVKIVFHFPSGEHNDAVFYRTDPLLYHKFGNMIIFQSSKLYSLCSPRNQHYQNIIFFIFSSKKVEIVDQSSLIKIYKLDLYIRPFLMKKIKKWIIFCWFSGLQSKYKFPDRNITIFPNLWYKNGLVL